MQRASRKHIFLLINVYPPIFAFKLISTPFILMPAESFYEYRFIWRQEKDIRKQGRRRPCLCLPCLLPGIVRPLYPLSLYWSSRAFR
jgi:hypothetical protein